MDSRPILKRPERPVLKRPEATRVILKRPEAPPPPPLKRPRAAIEAAMRKILSDPELAKLADREIARRTGLAPTTVGNWRRRLVTLL